MPNKEHVERLKRGEGAWNRWRTEKPSIRPELSRADLSRANLSGTNLSRADLLGAILIEANLIEANLTEADLTWADLIWADLTEANLSRANLTWANLSGANLSRANLSRTNFSEANLTQADLSGANLSRADLSGADLSQANLASATLTGTTLVETKFVKAVLSNCRVYGASAWNLKLQGAQQSDLIVTDAGEPTITVDNLEVAQFIHLLLYNEKIRGVVDTITSKVVLILGRFTPERKVVLDAIRDEIRTHGYLPVLFDFDVPSNRDITETISTLAHMARFVIADITDAKSIPQELERIVPGLPSLAIQPLLEASDHEYGMFEHYKRYPRVLDVHRYDNAVDLLASFTNDLIPAIEAKVKHIRNLH